MRNNNIQLTIITLTKNDNIEFLRTLKSINSQQISLKIEWLIIDGSSKIKQEKNNTFIKRFRNENKENNILTKHIDTKKRKIFGIYPCMNYAKKIAAGKFIMFLNGGDQFYNNNSLKIILKIILSATPKNTLIFGQANIIASNKLNWLFPGSKLSNFEKWIKLFEPNHQAMIISNKLAKIHEFPINLESISDGYWKRLIIENAEEIIYIKKPIINFFLDGVSSIKPSRKKLIKTINNKNIKLIRKLIFIIKYFFPKRLFFLYHLLQKYKSLLVDLIF